MTTLLAVLGPTASGKSELALEIAEITGAEILSVDSMQVYRGMDIGTAKPSPGDRARVRHHMIDLVEPSEEYTAARFRRDAHAILDVAQVPMVIAGGSGLHFRSLVDPLEFAPHDRALKEELERLAPAEARRRLVTADPGAGEHVDLDNPRRVARALEILELSGRSPSARAADPARVRVDRYEPERPFKAIGLDPGDSLRSRIEHRFRAMVASGLLDEVAGLDGRLGRTARQAVGYRQMLPVVRGETDLESGMAAAISATWALARRQRTFFRRDPRIEWLEWSDDPARRRERALARLEVTAS